MKRQIFFERSLVGVLTFLKDSIFSDEYAARRGFLQARDVRFRFIGILLLILGVLFSRNIYLISGIYVLCLTLAVISSINLGFFLKRTWLFIPLFALFIALPALFNIFSPGEAIASFKFFGAPFSVTRQGINGAGIFFMRVLTCVSLSVLLVLTTKHYALLKVLRIFKVPQIFVMTLGMCYRYLYLFVEVVENTCLAIKSRTAGVIHYKKGQSIVAWNIAYLWQRSYRLTEEVHSAMLSRGYSGDLKSADTFQITGADIAWVVFMAVIFTFTLLVKSI